MDQITPGMYALIYISAIPLLFILWRVAKASIGTRDLILLGLIGLIFLFQWVGDLISPDVMLGLIYILAGAAK